MFIAPDARETRVKSQQWHLVDGGFELVSFRFSQAADGSINTLRQVLRDMRRGDVLEILDGRKSPLAYDSGFDSGLGSQSLSVNRSEGEAYFFRKSPRAQNQPVSQSVRRAVHLSVR